MIHLLRGEWCKLYRRFVPYLAYAAILFLLLIIVAGTHFTQRDVKRQLNSATSGDFQTVGDPINAYTICQGSLEFLGLLMLPMMVPIVVGMVLGHEGADGTLRSMLVRPTSRTAIFWAKWLMGLFYTLSLALFMFAASYLLGRLVFGGGNLVSMNAMGGGAMIVMNDREAFTYLCFAHVMLTVSLWVVGSLAFCLSTFVDSALAPGFSALALWLVVKIVEVLPYEWLKPVQPYLFTHFLGQYREAFPKSFDVETQALLLDWPALRTTLLGCGAYIAAFTGLGWWRFVRRDVTC